MRGESRGRNLEPQSDLSGRHPLGTLREQQAKDLESQVVGERSESIVVHISYFPELTNVVKRRLLGTLSQHRRETAAGRSKIGRLSLVQSGGD